MKAGEGFGVPFARPLYVPAAPNCAAPCTGTVVAERCCWRGRSPSDKMLLSPLYLFLFPQDGISLKTLSEQGVRISNKKPRKASSAGSMLYGHFVKVTGPGDVAWRAAGISLKAVLNSATPLAVQPPQPITAVAPQGPLFLVPFSRSPSASLLCSQPHSQHVGRSPQSCPLAQRAARRRSWTSLRPGGEPGQAAHALSPRCSSGEGQWL